MQTTRRSFLVNGLRVAALAPLVSSRFPGRPGVDGDERVLVVLQLSGGNDALNTVIPHRQDAYFRLRPTISQDRRRLLALDDDHGLHPELRPLADVVERGDLAVLQGVGLPDPSRSHFRDMEVWHTADPDGPPGEDGWMGRLADQIAAAAPGTMAALHVGSGDLPLALRGRTYFSPTVRDARGFRLRDAGGSQGEARDRIVALPGGGAGDLAFLREAARTTYDAARRMAEVADAGPPVDYPGHGLAQRLQLVARLVSGGFGTRVFHVELGGFDTHAMQVAPHRALMSELGDSLAAFQADLEASGVADRVVTLVFSEFGRRVAENGSKGTDHGAGGVALLVGRAARGGLHGKAPDLARLEQGDVPVTTDFRALYATLERDWMGLRPTPGFRSLDLVDA